MPNNAFEADARTDYATYRDTMARAAQLERQTTMEALSEFRGLDEEHARAFAAAWLPAWSGNRPHDLIAFYTDDAYYSDPGVPAGLRGRDALLEYFIRLLAHNPNWRWTHRGSVPIRDGFLNEWHASMPVGARSIEVDGVCTVQLRGGLIYRNQVYFDRAPLLRAIEQLRGARPKQPEVLVPELRALRKLARDYPDSPYVFVTERKGPLTPDTVRKLTLRAGEAAKIGFPVHPHMLRHACGYKLANDGHDTRAIQRYLGHKNIQHTVRYTELAPDRFKNFWRD